MNTAAFGGNCNDQALCRGGIGRRGDRGRFEHAEEQLLISQPHEVGLDQHALGCVVAARQSLIPQRTAG
jgi:hypothetical protein